MQRSPACPWAWRVAIALLVLMLANAASAQNKNESPAGAKPAPPAQPAANPSTQPQANPPGQTPAQTPPNTEAQSSGDKKAANTGAPAEPDVVEASKSIRLGEQLDVFVKDLAALDKQAAGQPLVLYLEGYAMKGIPPRYEPQTNQIHYQLERTDNPETQKAWNQLLSGAKGIPPDARPVSVSVGYGTLPLTTRARTYLSVAHQWTYMVFFIGAAIVFLALVYLARHSNLIRDIGPDPEDAQGNRLPKLNRKGVPVKRQDGTLVLALKTYSLARVQLAFWLFLILMSFFFIWMVTTNRQSLPTFALGILGISAGTAVTSTLIDSSKRTASTGDRDALLAKLRDLRTQKTALGTPATTDDAAKAKLADLEKQIADTEADLTQLNAATKTEPSRGFWKDILSDDTGVTVHRFQIVAWTGALGIIFVATVLNSLTMPDYDGTLLALMGISSGAYLGLKPTEKQGG